MNIIWFLILHVHCYNSVCEAGREQTVDVALISVYSCTEVVPQEMLSTNSTFKQDCPLDISVTHPHLELSNHLSDFICRNNNIYNLKRE